MKNVHANQSRRVGLPLYLAGAGLLALAGCSGQASGARIGEGALGEGTGVVVQDLARGGQLRLSVGATGTIEIAPDFIQGAFFAQDTILRAKGHPECVAHVEAAEKPHSPAGTLTISSDRVGEPGGPAAPFVLNPDPAADELYLEFPDPLLYEAPDGSRTQVELSGNAAFPPLRRTVVRSPLFAAINVTAPNLPASGALAIPSSAALKFEWEVPTTPARHRGRQNVSARLFVLSPVRWIQLFCSWPVSDGHGSLPVVLLRAVRTLLETPEAVDAVLDVYGGEFREVATSKSSYVIFPTTIDATTLPRSTPAVFF